MGSERKRQILLGIFVMALVLANTLGAKITEFSLPDFIAWPFNIVLFPVIWFFNQILMLSGNDPLSYAFFNLIHVSVGILTVPLMFLVVDIVHEVWGQRVSKQFVKTGIIAMLIMIVITMISVYAPPAARFADQDAAYRLIFSTSIRMAIASILAFYLSQMHDIWAFHFWLKKTKGRFYWMRKCFSTFAGELVDSTIFMFVAFYDPATFTASMVIKLIIPYYIFKFLISILDTPFSYAGVKWARKLYKDELPEGKNA